MEGVVKNGVLQSGYFLTKSGNKVISIQFSLVKNIYGKIELVNGDLFIGYFNLSSPLKFEEREELIFPHTEYSKGILHKNNGDIIEGTWNKDTCNKSTCNKSAWNSKKYFYGKIRYLNGDVYIGHMYNNKYDDGILKTKSGYIFKGKWFSQNKFKGHITYPNGDQYEGSCQDNKKRGKGTLISGDITYYCHWKNDLKNGEGYKIFKNNRTEIYWKNDIEEEKIHIKCPECQKNLSFFISKHQIPIKYISNNNICAICNNNTCNTILPCNHHYCSICIISLNTQKIINL